MYNLSYITVCCFSQLSISECDELVEHRIALEVELEDLRQRRHAAERQADLATAREQNALAVGWKVD